MAKGGWRSPGGRGVTCYPLAVNRRRMIIAGMWVVAFGAIGAIYWNLEPKVDEVRTREGGDAPTFVVGEDVAEPSSRLGLDVAPAQSSNASYRGGPRHTGQSPFRGPTTPSRAWVYDAGGRITAQAVIGDDGAIFVGAHDHRFHALSADGEPVWAVDLHERVWAAAAVATDTVYVGSDADALFALDRRTGEIRWRIRVEGDADGPPTVIGDTVYFTAGPHLYAVSTEGELRWRFQARGPFLLSSPAVDSDGTIYVGSIDDHLYAVAPDGRMRWDYETGDNISSSPVIGDDGTIYIGSDDQRVHALDRDGARRWSVDLDGFVRAPLALGRNGDVIVALYGPRPRVVSLDAQTGELRWYFPVGSTDSSEIGVASGPLVDSEGSIYFGAHDDFLYALSGDGRMRWIHQVGADIDAAPILRDDGVLIVGSDDGSLYAIAASEESEPGAGDAADAGAADAGAEAPASD